MRRFQLLLFYAAFLALYFDVSLILQIYAYGFPLDHTIEFTTDGRIVDTPTPEQRVQFALVLLLIGLVQAVVFRLAWKARRR